MVFGYTPYNRRTSARVKSFCACDRMRISTDLAASLISGACRTCTTTPPLMEKDVS